MIATDVTLNNFRNWSRLSLTPHPRLNLITGPNAQGKSNLLEALYALATTRPYRAQKDVEVVRFGELFAHVHASFATAERQLSCDIMWERLPDGRHRKEVRLNKQPAHRLLDVFGVARMVLFTPRDLELVTGGPEGRRRYMDVVLSQMHTIHLHALTKYQKVLSERNRLLRMRNAGASVDRQLQDAFDEQLVKWGAGIIDRRKIAVQKLAIRLETIYRSLSGAREAVRLRYIPSAPSQPGETTEEALTRQLLSRARQEVERGMTLSGPHRDDIAVLLEGHPMRHYGSQGQIRCMSIAMRLAEAELLADEGGESPLLLLDDCLSEMDLQRQDVLWSYLATRDQVFLTTSVWPTAQDPPFTGRVFRVWDGALSDKDTACCA